MAVAAHHRHRLARHAHHRRERLHLHRVFAGRDVVSVKLPSLSVRDVPPGMNCMASFIAGMSMTMAPLIGLPSELTAFPVILASRTGCIWRSIDSSWPTASASRCASPGFGVPG